MTDQPDERDEQVYSQFQLSDRASKPICVNVQANGRSLDMEVDTGASLSIISEEVYLATWPEQERPPLEPSRVKLRTYSGDIIRAISLVPRLSDGLRGWLLESLVRIACACVKLTI